MSFLTQALLRILRVLGLVYLGLMVTMFFLQRRVIFYPDSTLDTTPDKYGFDYENRFIKTDTGILIHSWFIPVSGAENTVLICHGNAGNISHRIDTIRIFCELKCNVLIFDYRGYGQSQKCSITEAGLYEDAEAAWRFLVTEKGLPEENIIVFGRSLGASIAAWLAARHPCGGVILESPFQSIPDLGKKYYPYLPVRLLSRFKFPTEEYVSRINTPILLAHSPSDELIPFSHGRAVFARCNEPRYFLEMTGSHNDGFLVTGQQYIDGFRDFIKRLGSSRISSHGPVSSIDSGIE